MNNILFYNSFSFRVFTRKGDSHTDNSDGITTNYIARLTEGHAKIVSAGVEMHISKGDVFFLPLGLCYKSFWYGDGKDGVVSWESYGFQYFPEKDYRELKMQKLMLDFETEKILAELSDSGTVNARSVGLLYLLLEKTVLNKSNTVNSQKESLKERARAYIEEHPDFKVSDLARHCNMSESGLYAFFKKHFKDTPIGTKNRIKIKKAKVLLETTNMSIEEISGALGFSSSSYFRKVVKDLTGKTPQRIRKEARQI